MSKSKTETATAEQTSTALAIAQETSAVVRGVSEADAAAAFEGFAMMPKFVVLADGDMVRGEFVRFGEVESSPRLDKLTGEYASSLLKTVVLMTTDGPIEFLSAHDINRALNKCEKGWFVQVLRLGDRRIKNGNMVTEYRVGVRPR